jgi:hypothetical protein
MRESHIEIDIKNINKFITWIDNDVWKEESDRITKSLLSSENINKFKKSLKNHASIWYKNYLKTFGDE